jgi:hypothetical protein
VLNVCSNFFVHKWEQHKGKLELMIDVPADIEAVLQDEAPNASDDEREVEPYPYALSEQLLRRRRDAFSDELVATCYDYYADNHSIGEEDDAQSIRGWPVDFDVNEVPEILEHPLKEKPEVKVMQSMNEFLSKDSNNVEDFSDVSSLKSQSSQMSEILSQSGVSESTINRIAQINAHQNAVRERNEHIMETTEKLKNIEQHQKTAVALCDHFRRKDKNVVYWNEFFAVLKESWMNTGEFGEEKEYRQQLFTLVKACPGWITTASLPKGILIKQVKKGVQEYDLRS